MANFWEKLNKPFFCLAPMEEVTDVVFREMFAKYGKPDVMYTEFINVDGLTHPEGRKRLEIDLRYTNIQRPMVAQIWGRSPLVFEEAAKIVADLGFDGIDINMGCPQDKEIGIGACAALIKEPQLAIEIIKHTKKGAGNLPVSVKTRLGYNHNEVGSWMRHLLSAEPAAIAVHGRTKKEKSKVPANWQAIGEAVKVRDEMFPLTRPDKSRDTLSRGGRGLSSGLRPLIIGNGDIKSREEGMTRILESKVDGVMVGRGAFGNPWFFRADGYQPNLKERLAVMLEHAQGFEKEFSGIKSFFIMRKHFKAYCSGFPGASELRVKLMEAQNLVETKMIVESFLAEEYISAN